MSTEPTTQLQQNVPTPQTIQGVITTHAMPLIHQPVVKCNSITTILTRNHMVAALTLSTGDVEPIFDQVLPFKIGTQRSFFEALMNMGVYITTGLNITMWLNAPDPVTAKFLIEYSPDDEGEMGVLHQSSKIEWDVGGAKFISIPLLSATSSRKKIASGPRSAGNVNGPDYYSPGFKYPDNAATLGRLRMTAISPLQAGSLFPDDFTLYIFMAFIDPQLSTIRTYRTLPGESFINYVT